MRLFIAIPLASEAVGALERLAHTLRSASDALRWTSPATWHITLQFLGETSLETYDCLAQQLRAIHSPPVPVWLHGTGCFDRAGVFFAAVNVSPELRRLEQLVLAATALCGLTAEARPYHPPHHPRTHPGPRQAPRTPQTQKPRQQRHPIPRLHRKRIPALRILPRSRRRTPRDSRSLPPRLTAPQPQALRDENRLKAHSRFLKGHSPVLKAQPSLESTAQS
jgi:hypothetical protein